MASRALNYTGRRGVGDPRHLLRYLKAQAGLDVPEIAKLERVSEAAVRQSIRQIEAYRQQNTSMELDMAARDLFISSVPKAKQTLQGLLEATELVEKKDEKTGKVKVITVADKTTRIEAMKVMTSLITALQPKAPSAQVNVQQTNQTAVISSSETNEERFRRLRKKADEFNALPPQVAAVPDHIDAGRDADDDGEDEDEDEEGEDDDE